nr:hypothetical protein B0A51_10736 [Rachicladosporium sp. CCFEE 5018]
MAEAPVMSASATATPSAPSRAESFRSAISQNGTPATSTQSTSVGAEQEEVGWTAPAGTLKVPIPRPSATSKTPKPAELTAEQEVKFATVFAQVSQWTSLPTTTLKGAASAPVQDHERMFLTHECILRYLRATKWNTANALKRLQSTLSWRREYGADTFTFDYISPENETGKQIILGYDNDARPCLYLSPGKQNTKMSDRQIHHLCFMLDHVIDMMPPGQETTALLINFSGAAGGSVPSVGQARAVLNILQGHNPERLGRALISQLPWYVNIFFKAIAGFIDPVTKEKMKFNEDLRIWVPPEQLWNQATGDLDFEYDHAVYWKALQGECEKRRKAYRERWESGGKRIGEFEAYLRGGDAKSLGQKLEEAGKLEGVEANGKEKVDVDLAAAEVAKLTV